MDILRALLVWPFLESCFLLPLLPLLSIPNLCLSVHRLLLQGKYGGGKNKCLIPLLLSGARITHNPLLFLYLVCGLQVTAVGIYQIIPRQDEWSSPPIHHPVQSDFISVVHSSPVRSAIVRFHSILSNCGDESARQDGRTNRPYSGWEQFN